MGGAASISVDNIKNHPQFRIVGNEVKDEVIKAYTEVNTEVCKKLDPYLKYGGSYRGNHKDTKKFHYVTFDELPKVCSQYYPLLISSWLYLLYKFDSSVQSTNPLCRKF